MRAPGTTPRRVWAPTTEAALTVDAAGTREAFACVVCCGSVQLWPENAHRQNGAFHFACNRCGAHGLVSFRGDVDAPE